MSAAPNWREFMLSGVPEMLDGCQAASTEVLTAGLQRFNMPDGTPAKTAATYVGLMQATATLQAAATLEQAINQLHEGIAGRLDDLIRAVNKR